MELNCSWNRIETPAGGAGADPAASLQLYQRPPSGGPCQLTLPVQQPVRGVRVVSNARVCEVSAQGPSEPAPSYICSLRGEREPAANAEAPTFATVFQTEAGLQVGSVLVLRLLSLSPSKDELRLHGIEWLPMPEQRDKAENGMAGSTENGMESATGSCSGHSGDLLTEADAQAQQAEQQQQQQQQQRQAERGGSQMEEIRSMLQSVALEGEESGSSADPKRSLMAALARTALSQPGSQVAAAPQLAGAAGGLPPWAAAFMQAAFSGSRPSQQQHPAAAAAAAASTAQLAAVPLPAAQPSFARVHDVGGSSAANGRSGSGDSSGGTEAAAAGAAGAPLQIAGHLMQQLECVLASRLESSLGQLEARLLRALHQAGSIQPGAAAEGSQLGPAGSASPQQGGLAGAAPSSQGEEVAAEVAAAGGFSVVAGGAASIVPNSPFPGEGNSSSSGSSGSGSGSGGHGALALPVAVLQRLDSLEERMVRLERQGDELRALLLQLLGSGSRSTAQP